MRGRLVNVAVATPAAGAEWSHVVPAGKRWRVRSITQRISTDATVANRQVGVVASAGAVQFAAANMQFNVTASSVIKFFIPAGQGDASFRTNLGNLSAPSAFPDVDLVAGETIGSVTVALQAGDQYDQVVLRVEEWDE